MKYNLPSLNDLSKTVTHRVPFTAYPQHELTPICATGDELNHVIGQARFLSFVLQSPRATLDETLAVRYLLAACCAHIINGLEQHHPDSQLVLDVTPWGFLLAGPKLQEAFNAFHQSVQRHSPKLYKSILKLDRLDRKGRCA